MKQQQQGRSAGVRSRRSSSRGVGPSTRSSSKASEWQDPFAAISADDLGSAPLSHPGSASRISRRGSSASPPSAVRPISRRAARRSPHRTLAWESTLVSLVNLVLTAAAIGGAVRLLPVQLAQHHRLQLLEEQVNNMSDRVSRLQDALDRGMDPEQKDALIKERFNKVPPNHLQVRLVPGPIDASTIATDPDQPLQQAKAYSPSDQNRFWDLPFNMLKGD